MRSNSTFIAFICLIACITQFSSDVYSPSLVAISDYMGIDISMAQFSMSIYLISLTLTIIPFGLIADAYGRKKPLLAGAIMLIIGSIVCSLANEINTLLLGRLIQGAGAGAISSLWRSIFRDRFKGPEMAKYASYVMITVTFVMPAAPAVGGFLQKNFGWSANFVFLTAYSAILLVLISTLYKDPEDLELKSSFKLNESLASVKRVFMNSTFLRYTSINFIAYGAIFSSIVITPVVLIDIVGMAPEKFGSMMLGISASSMALAGFVNSRALKKYSPLDMLKFGFYIMLLSGIMMILLYFIEGTNIISVAIPLWLFLFGSSFIWPNSIAKCFEAVKEGSGIVGAAYTFMQQSGGSIIGSLASFMHDTNQLGLGYIFLGTAIYCVVILWRVKDN